MQSQLSPPFVKMCPATAALDQELLRLNCCDRMNKRMKLAENDSPRGSSSSVPSLADLMLVLPPMSPQDQLLEFPHLEGFDTDVTDESSLTAANTKTDDLFRPHGCLQNQLGKRSRQNRGLVRSAPIHSSVHLLLQ
jgi:hypothetical protein